MKGLCADCARSVLRAQHFDVQLVCEDIGGAYKYDKYEEMEAIMLLERLMIAFHLGCDC